MVTPSSWKTSAAEARALRYSKFVCERPNPNGNGDGAVIDWVYRYVAGIAPDRSEPGSRKIRFAPNPAVGVDWARASVATPYWKAAIDWRIEGGRFIAEIDTPAGTCGLFVRPSSGSSEVTLDDRVIDAVASFELPAGVHRVVVTQPAIVSGRRFAERGGITWITRATWAG
jgi:hypothetical protein